MNNIRQAAVAGTFYPAHALPLAQQIDTFLSAVEARPHQPPKALMVPHAGYIYSGPIAATAYARLRPLREQIQRVVLLGPTHRVAFNGLAASSAQAFASPFGEVLLEQTAIQALLRLPQVQVFDQAHAQEHSLEVHLPFLQHMLADFRLIPLLVGQTSPAEVAQVLEQLWGGAETLIVISSDLSHYQNYASAQQRDAATSQAIENLDENILSGSDACGCYPLNGLLHIAKAKGMQVETLDLRNSGDTAGSKDAVVGYGAYAFH